MNDKALLRTGIIGAVIAAICCFTPLLVILLGAVGLTAWLLWFDYAVFAALIAFLGLLAFVLVKRRKAG